MDTSLNLRYLLQNKEINNVSCLLEGLNKVFGNIKVHSSDVIKNSMLDIETLEEINKLPYYVRVSFGKTLTDIKCTITDDNAREHHVLVEKQHHKKKIKVISVNLPFTSFQDQEYNNFEELTDIFLHTISDLSSFFDEIENIDRKCIVVEPKNPTFKDDFRNICLDDRTWLHIEITAFGAASNIHLIGQSDKWQNQLQKGLLNWDHDKNIVENILVMFDLDNLLDIKCTKDISIHNTEAIKMEECAQELTCAICFCTELPDNPGLPQPLCQNTNCNVSYHKSCLFQWLVACEGGRPPAFGVINGSCPTCLHPISCNEKD